jgi:YD repeat-containing protein
MTRTKTGAPLTVTQNSVTRAYQYDGRYRLKRQIRPETEDVLFKYDENGNLKVKNVEGLGKLSTPMMAAIT